MAGVVEKLKKLSRRFTAKNKEPYTGISSDSIRRVSEESGISRYEIEKIALENNIIPLRYQRHIGSFGISGQIAFLTATVIVIGAGGLGGLVVELLARAGTGHIIIADPDKFEEENLNRQILSTTTGLNHQKAYAAKKRIQRINPSLRVTHHNTALDETNARALISGADIVVDCVDHIPTRLIIQETASHLHIPMVSAAVADSSGYVTTILPGDIGWKALVNTIDVPERGAEILTGTSPASPAFAASLEVQEVVKLLTGKGEILKDKLFFFDLETAIFEIISISVNYF
jgi:molybdopterin/thiamine biosynthesis adenylyltransferase